MATNIALLIDILIIAAGAGVVASLSFAEWQRALVTTKHIPQFASDYTQTVPAVATSTSGDQTLTRFSFLIFFSLFSFALFVGGWYGSIPMAEWSVVVLAVLSALSITQTLFVAIRWQRTRPARNESRPSREADA